MDALEQHDEMNIPAVCDTTFDYKVNSRNRLNCKRAVLG